jgi:hypothetical protein
MLVLLLLLLLVVTRPGSGQEPCQPTPTYSPCDVVFELTSQEAASHPNPYLSVELEVEFRSPKHRTLLMPGFWDGGRRFVVRFAPTEAGRWDFRVSSNITRFEGKEASMTATPSESPGFLKAANVHHWAYTEEMKPHLWMGDTLYTFPFLERPVFDKVVDARAAQKFNHVRGVILSRPDAKPEAFSNPDEPNPAFFRELDQRIAYMNGKGIIADLVFAWDKNQLNSVFPNWKQRERYVRYLVARYAPMNITWQGVQEFEEYENGRQLLKEIGTLLKKMDPYRHPRSTHTLATSAPLMGDGWMDYVTYQSSDDQLGSIEHQLYPVPFVNSEFAYEDSGAGKTHPHHVDTDAFRRRLWNSSMDGQYPTFGNTGTYGGVKSPVDPKFADSPGARQMTAWYDFFSGTRHWELEPYFDVDGGRAVALEGVEYIVYIEKPGPVEIVVEKHGYDVAWFNPITGERIREKKGFKGERFTGEPPDKTHDWVLHISREGRKEGMLRSWKFDSREENPITLQEVEQTAAKTPFEIADPAANVFSMASPPKYALKITRETRATRSMMFLWTGEVATDGQGFRILGTGQHGSMKLPHDLARNYPAVMNLRLYGMNALGKVYALDRIYKLTQ